MLDSSYDYDCARPGVAQSDGFAFGDARAWVFVDAGRISSYDFKEAAHEQHVADISARMQNRRNAFCAFIDVPATEEAMRACAIALVLANP